MHSYLVGLVAYILASTLISVPSLCVPAGKTLTKLRRYAGSIDPLLLVSAISTLSNELPHLILLIADRFFLYNL